MKERTWDQGILRFGPFLPGFFIHKTSELTQVSPWGPLAENHWA